MLKANSPIIRSQRTIVMKAFKKEMTEPMYKLIQCSHFQIK